MPLVWALRGSDWGNVDHLLAPVAFYCRHCMDNADDFKAY